MRPSPSPSTAVFPGIKNCSAFLLRRIGKRSRNGRVQDQQLSPLTAFHRDVWNSHSDSPGPRLPRVALPEAGHTGELSTEQPLPRVGFRKTCHVCYCVEISLFAECGNSGHFSLALRQAVHFCSPLFTSELTSHSCYSPPRFFFYLSSEPLKDQPPAPVPTLIRSVFPALLLHRNIPSAQVAV